MNGKLKLDLDQLTVDSFDTQDEKAGAGTVFGEQCTCYTNCTCPGCPTCDNTACGQNTCGGATCGQNTCGQNTCGASCYGTCGYTCDGGWNCGYTALQTNCNEICH